MNRQLKSHFSVFLWALLALGFILACAVAVSNRWYSWHLNLSDSLNGHVYVVTRNGSVEKGDILGFRWKGDQYYAPGAVFIKIVVGVQGDRIETKGNQVFVNGELVAIAKNKTKTGDTLSIIQPQVIGKGQYFVATPSKDGYDSRYSQVGLVDEKRIMGKAYEVF